MTLSSKIVALLLSFVCAGAAQAGGKLGLVNVRPTYGVNGPARPDNKYLPGDRIDLSFDINNITIDPKTGQARWKMVMEVFDDKKPKSIFSKENTNEMVAALGGRQLPAYCFVSMGLDQPPGKYTLRVTVTDTANKATTAYDHKFVVGDKAFGLVGLMAQPIALTSQTSGARFDIVGMKRDGKDLFDLKVSMRILDDKGKPTLQQSLTNEFPKDLPMGVEPKTLNVLPVVFPIELNRAGRFRVEVEATDRLAKITRTLSYTLTVLDASGK